MFDLENNDNDTNDFIKVDDKTIKSEDYIIRSEMKVAYFTKSADKPLNDISTMILFWLWYHFVIFSYVLSYFNLVKNFRDMKNYVTIMTKMSENIKSAYKKISNLKQVPGKTVQYLSWTKSLNDYVYNNYCLHLWMHNENHWLRFKTKQVK